MRSVLILGAMAALVGCAARPIHVVATNRSQEIVHMEVRREGSRTPELAVTCGAGGRLDWARDLRGGAELSAQLLRHDAPVGPATVTRIPAGAAAEYDVDVIDGRAMVRHTRIELH